MTPENYDEMAKLREENENLRQKCERMREAAEQFQKLWKESIEARGPAAKPFVRGEPKEPHKHHLDQPEREMRKPEPKQDPCAPE